MTTFQCWDCEKEFPVGGTGYAILHKIEEKVCYECAAKRDVVRAGRREPITAYVGKTLGDGMGCDRHGSTSRRELTTWPGIKIGTCYLGKSWPRGRWKFDRLYQVYAVVDGVTFTGRSQGEGTYVNLRPVSLAR